MAPSDLTVRRGHSCVSATVHPVTTRQTRQLLAVLAVLLGAVVWNVGWHLGWWG